MGGTVSMDKLEAIPAVVWNMHKLIDDSLGLKTATLTDENDLDRMRAGRVIANIPAVHSFERRPSVDISDIERNIRETDQRESSKTEKSPTAEPAKSENKAEPSLPETRVMTLVRRNSFEDTTYSKTNISILETLSTNSQLNALTLTFREFAASHYQTLQRSDYHDLHVQKIFLNELRDAFYISIAAIDTRHLTQHQKNSLHKIEQSLREAQREIFALLPLENLSKYESRKEFYFKKIFIQYLTSLWIGSAAIVSGHVDRKSTTVTDHAVDFFKSFASGFPAFCHLIGGLSAAMQSFMKPLLTGAEVIHAAEFAEHLPFAHSFLHATQHRFNQFLSKLSGTPVYNQSQLLAHFFCRFDGMPDFGKKIESLADAFVHAYTEQLALLTARSVAILAEFISKHVADYLMWIDDSKRDEHGVDGFVDVMLGWIKYGKCRTSVMLKTEANIQEVSSYDLLRRAGLKCHDAENKIVRWKLQSYNNRGQLSSWYQSDATQFGYCAGTQKEVEHLQQQLRSSERKTTRAHLKASLSMPAKVDQVKLDLRPITSKAEVKQNEESIFQTEMKELLTKIKMSEEKFSEMANLAREKSDEMDTKHSPQAKKETSSENANLSYRNLRYMGQFRVLDEVKKLSDKVNRQQIEIDELKNKIARMESANARPENRQVSRKAR